MRFLLLTLLFIPMLCAAHPIHVSVTEINHNAEEQILELTIKIFEDDFNDVLEDRTGQTILLGKEGEHKKTDRFIEEYIKEKFVISINGKPAQLEFIRKEVEDIACWTYVRITGVSEIEKLTIQNSILIHWFDDQINVVHVDYNGRMNSTFFSEGKETDEFEF